MEPSNGLPPELKELSELPGLPGFEEEVRSWLIERFTRLHLPYHVDSMGNLLVASRGMSGTLQGSTSYRKRKVMLAAHMDEVGLIVSDIEDSGLLRFQGLGGIDERVLAAKPVFVGPNRLPGVIGLKPFHLQTKDERSQTISRRNLYIDIGARNRADAARWVKPGDGVVFDTVCEPFGQGFYKGKAFDDRAGCYLLYKLLTSGLDIPFYAAFTVQEEVGLRGAGTAASFLEPDLAVVLEATTCADLPGTAEHEQATRLGHGPVITRSDSATISDPYWTEVIVGLAETAGVPWQWKRTHLGGNDAGRIHLSAGGIPSISISVPCRYIHSPVSVLSADDLYHAYQLVELFLHQAVREGGE